MLVLETLEKEEVHCQLDKLCEAKGSFAVQYKTRIKNQH